MAGVYYENKPVQLTVANGASKVLALPYPNRVRLTKLNIVQVGAAPYTSFTVNIYNRVVTDVPSADLSDFTWLISDPAGILSDAPGRLDFKFKDYDVFFFNQDDPAYLQVRGQNTPTLLSTQAQYVIYFRITNTGATTATFNVVLGSESPHEL